MLKGLKGIVCACAGAGVREFEKLIRKRSRWRAGASSKLGRPGLTLV